MGRRHSSQSPSGAGSEHGSSSVASGDELAGEAGANGTDAASSWKAREGESPLVSRPYSMALG